MHRSFYLQYQLQFAKDPNFPPQFVSLASLVCIFVMNLMSQTHAPRAPTNYKLGNLIFSFSPRPSKNSNHPTPKSLHFFMRQNWIQAEGAARHRQKRPNFIRTIVKFKDLSLSHAYGNNILKHPTPVTTPLYSTNTDILLVILILSPQLSKCSTLPPFTFTHFIIALIIIILLVKYISPNCSIHYIFKTLSCSFFLFKFC